MSMHRLLAVLVVAFGVLASRGALADAMPYADGVLWRVEGAGQPPSHVFGTLHSSDERITSLPEAVSAAFGEARTLAIEVILDDAATFKVGKAMMLPSGKRLDALLTPEQVAQLKDVAAHYHMPFAMVTRFKPWGAMILFSYPPAEFRRSAAGKEPLDEMLQTQAEAAGKTVIGLETVDEQIETLDGMVEADQMMLLDSTLEQAGEIESVFATLRDAYLAGDLAAVYDVMNAAKAGDDTGAIERFEQRLIVDRNRRMVERMDGLLQEGDAFVAVGALHLPGRQGILQLLADRGYRVTRVH